MSTEKSPNNTLQQPEGKIPDFSLTLNWHLAIPWPDIKFPEPSLTLTKIHV